MQEETTETSKRKNTDVCEAQSFKKARFAWQVKGHMKNSDEHQSQFENTSANEMQDSACSTSSNSSIHICSGENLASVVSFEGKDLKGEHSTENSETSMIQARENKPDKLNPKVQNPELYSVVSHCNTNNYVNAKKRHQSDQNLNALLIPNLGIDLYSGKQGTESNPSAQKNVDTSSRLLLEKKSPHGLYHLESCDTDNVVLKTFMNKSNDSIYPHRQHDLLNSIPPVCLSEGSKSISKAVDLDLAPIETCENDQCNIKQENTLKCDLSFKCQMLEMDKTETCLVNSNKNQEGGNNSSESTQRNSQNPDQSSRTLVLSPSVTRVTPPGPQTQVDYLTRWQNQHTAKAVVDNAVNKTLEGMGLSPNPEINNIMADRYQVEDEAIAAAIRRQGLITQQGQSYQQRLSPIISQLTQASELVFEHNFRPRPLRTRSVDGTPVGGSQERLPNWHMSRGGRQMGSTMSSGRTTPLSSASNDLVDQAVSMAICSQGLMLQNDL